MNRNAMKTLTILTLFCLALAAGMPGAVQAGWLENYYKTHPVSTDQLKAKWGEPANVIQMKAGVEKMIFGPKDVVIGYTYFLVRDGQVVGRGIPCS